jgi:alpha-tubulin suppressor-like RCC1 family protein
MSVRRPLPSWSCSRADPRASTLARVRIRALRLAHAIAGLLVSALVFGGCSHSVLIFEADGAAPDEDAALDAGADAARETDASGEEASVGPGENDAGGGEGAHALAAHEQTCVAREEASYCWGRGADGQLGIGPMLAPEFKPVRLERAPAYTQLCAGERHTCGLRPDGGIDCWGGNAKGQLGINSRSARDVPTPVQAMVDFKWLSCAGELTCAVGKDEELYCWGDNFEGQGGQEDPAGAPDLLVPTRVMIERGIAQVSAGQGHVCALTNAGALYCWGRNTEAQLGLGRGVEQQLRRPTVLPGGNAYMSIAAGQRHTCAVRRDRRLFCWGERLDGRLGLGPGVTDVVYEPAQVGSFADWQSVQANWFHTCGLRAGELLFCWGRNAEGQLGVGDEATREVPTRVATLEGVTAFTVGHFHTCAARPGDVYCWGKNDEGQVGLNLRPADRPNLPMRVTF